MQIHELNTFAGAPGNTDYLPIDDGEETTKIPLNEMSVLPITFSSFSSLPQTISNAAITSDMVVVASEIGNPSAQTGDWTVTTSNGAVQVSGSIGGTTTLKLYLMHAR